MSDDIFLRDYSRAFKGELGVPNASWVQEYMRIETKAQHKDTVEAANCTFDIDANGNILIRQGSSVILVEAGDRVAFQGALFSLPSSGGPYPGPGVYGGQSSAPVSNHINNDDRLQRQEQMERSFKEMAKIGQPRYDRHG